MAKAYKKFTPGDSLSPFPGGSWNRMADAARWVDLQRTKSNTGENDTPGKQALYASVRNATGEKLELQYPVLGIRGPTVKIEDDASIVSQDAQLDGVKPDPKKHRNNFCVLQAEAGKDDVNTGVVRGYTMARVDLKKKGHKTCGVEKDNVEYLVSGIPGANIVWSEKQDQEGDEVGEQWCLVDLTPGTPLFELTNCDDPTDKFLVSNFLEEQVGKVVMVDSICYKVDYPPDGNECAVGICVEVQQEFGDCKECKGPSGNCCWELVSCGTGSFFIKDCNFAIYEGQVVKWKDNKCYLVLKAPSCEKPEEGSAADVKGVFKNCAECQGCVELVECCSDEIIYVPSETLEDFQRVVGTIVKVGGTCYEVLQYPVNCPGNEILLPSDGIVYEDCTTCGCYEFHRCSPEQGVKVTCRADWFGGMGPFDLAELKPGDVVTLGSPNAPECWELMPPDPDTDCSVAEDIQIIEVYKDCQCCVGWKLEECSDQGNEVVYTQNSDMCEYYDFFTGAMKEGVVLKRAAEEPYDKCFDKLTEVAIGEPFSWEEFLVDTEHGSCEQCDDPRFKLTDADCKKEVCGECGDKALEDPIITDEDLNEAVDKIIKYKGVCWNVAEAPGEEITDPAPIKWEGPFVECEPCLKAPSCIEFVTDIDWDEKKVKYTTFMVAVVKCGERESDIPVEPCPENRNA